ncbi:TPA: phospholipase D-like domain-containing protein [Photobacterium damselae]
MDLVLNENRDNHRRRLVSLITESDQIVLCSGWLKHAGLKSLLPAMKTAIERKNVEITVYSNSRHTEPKCVEALNELKGIRHIVVDADTKYLHTKLYYFASTTHYTAVIGSANITQGGLTQNDELSVELCGELGDESHRKLIVYLEKLSRYG